MSPTDDSLSVQLARECECLSVPGASLAWHSARETRLAQAGFAHIGNGLQVKAETVFQIGSVTKLFTGTLMVMLAEEGKIDLDRPVVGYLPDLKLAGRSCSPEITVRMLLNHTSGIDGNFMDDTGDGPEAIGRFVQACRNVRILSEPGEKFAYSNAAYVIAGHIIEVVTGVPYNAFLRQRLIEPLGMKRYGSFEDELSAFECALGYAWTGDAFELPASHHTPAAHAPAGSRLSMTADDLMQFALLHLRNGLGPDGRLLSEEGALAMRAASGLEAAPGMMVHVSWASVPLGAGRLYLHTGATIEQSSILCLAPDHGAALALLTNTGNGAWGLFSSLGYQLLEAATGHRPNIAV